ncbi:MAG: hypothetical protein QOF52_1956 [Propionibacteriaceae bacterium]|nr:hypothetical protein [Propionibacteriaceae bacterium]
MSPRRSTQHAQQTRHAILAAGVALASVEGLEPLSLGRLAAVTGVSKSGIAGHFGSKEALQLAVLQEAVRTFRREITVPAQRQAPGLARLQAVAENWLSYLNRGVFPGGCFFTNVTSEFDGRDGPVREVIAGVNEDWRRYLATEIRAAVQRGELAPGTDPEQLIFELMGLMLSLNHSLQLDGDARAVDRARVGLARLLRSVEAQSV